MIKRIIYNPQKHITKSTGLVHTIINSAEKIRKMAKPYKVTFRAKKLKNGVLIIAYWGKKKNGKHSHYVINKIIHSPKVSHKTLLKSFRKNIKNVKKIIKNPPKLVKIYENVLKIYAQKGKDSNYPKQKFVHTFKKGATMYGTPEGYLLIKGKKPLWKMFRA